MFSAHYCHFYFEDPCFIGSTGSDIGICNGSGSTHWFKDPALVALSFAFMDVVTFYFIYFLLEIVEILKVHFKKLSNYSHSDLEKL